MQKLPWKVYDFLHREMIGLAYLFDIQLIRSNLMFGDLRYSRRFTEFFGFFEPHLNHAWFKVDNTLRRSTHINVILYVFT